MGKIAGDINREMMKANGLTEVESLRQQLADTQNNVTLLRDELNTIYTLVPDLVVLMKPSALAATAGKWAELVSDGTNWITMATG